MCGFVGFTGPSEVGAYLKIALNALQHRGQDSAGMAVYDGTNFHLHKDLGLASKVFENIDFNYPGAGVAHVRYSTRGKGTRLDAQPFFACQPGILMTHNGNLVNHEEMNSYLKSRSINLSSNCDIEPFLYIFSDKLMKTRGTNHSIDDVIWALKETYKIVKGSYSIAAVLNIDSIPTLICVRDPFGIRPAVWGKLDDGSYICASESVCIDMVAGKYMGSVKPGEMMLFRHSKEPQKFLIEQNGKTPCVFEDIYFARADSYSEDGQYIYSKRINLGKALSNEIIKKNIKVDVVVPVPDTASPAALAVAEGLNVSFRQGFIKNRYSGRTFIMPTQYSRENMLRLKLNPIVSEIENKDILLVDDSLVRGTTLRRVVQLLKKSNVKKIHLAIHCPPIINPCFYGIDMSIKEELFAYKMLKDLGLENEISLNQNQLNELELIMAKEIGVDSLSFLSIDSLNELYTQGKCSACFDGKYAVSLTKNMIDDVRCNRLTCNKT